MTAARPPNVQREWVATVFRWDDNADRILADAYAKGVPAENIVAMIGCSTVHQIRNRAAALKIKHRQNNRTLDERFWDYVSPEPNSGCWLWTGTISSTGYGQLRMANSGRHSLMFATHISLMLAGKPLPDGLYALHRCDNSYCVNPDHLFAGTQLDNIRDAMAKGRHSKPPLCQKGSRPLKTICVNGHSLTGDNVYVRPDGFRTCRQCRLDFKVRKRAKFKSLGLTSRGNERVRVDG
jgi:hypothetical protein